MTVLLLACYTYTRKFKYGKKLAQTWSPAWLAAALATTKGKAWSSSCSKNVVVPEGTWIMEHDPQEFKSENNPIGVGPTFGVTKDDGINESNELDVLWCDNERLPIPQTLSWQCPPVNRNKSWRVKHPETGKQTNLWLLAYTDRGAKLLVQSVEPDVSAPKSPVPKPAPKARSAESPRVKKTARKSTRNYQRTNPAPNAKPAAKSPSKKPAPKATSPKKKPASKAKSPKKKPASKTKPAAKSPSKKPAATRKSTRKRQRTNPATKAKPVAKSPSKKPAARRKRKVNDPSSDQEHPSIKKWMRFRRKPLSSEQLRLIDEQVVLRESELVIDSNFDKTQWHCFMNRVAREYLYVHNTLHKDDEMHLHRETVLESALATVLSQVRPVNQYPFAGDMTEIMLSAQPILEIALNLSGPAKIKKNTMAWIAEKTNSPGDITYAECDQYPELMEAYVEHKIAECIAAGNKNGYLVLHKGEKPVGTDKVYTLCSTRVGRRRALASDVVML